MARAGIQTFLLTARNGNIRDIYLAPSAVDKALDRRRIDMSKVIFFSWLLYDLYEKFKKIKRVELNSRIIVILVGIFLLKLGL